MMNKKFVALMLSVCCCIYLINAVDAQVQDSFILHKKRVINRDVLRFNFSNTTNVGERTLQFDRIHFLDSGGGILDTIDFGVAEARKSFGKLSDPEVGGDRNGWSRSDDSDPEQTFVWSHGLEVLIFHAIPSNAVTLRIITKLPAIPVTTTLHINNDFCGQVNHLPTDPLLYSNYDFSLLALKRKLFIDVIGAANMTVHGVQLLNADNQVTWSVSGLNHNPAQPIEVSTVGEPCDVLINATVTGAQPGAAIRCYLNRHNDEMFLMQRALLDSVSTYDSGDYDALLRQTNVKVQGPAPGWSEDFMFLPPMILSPNTNSSVTNGILTVNHSSNGDGEIFARLDHLSPITIGEGGNRYLIVRVRVPKDVVYFIRMETPANVLLTRTTSSLEPRTGTGDWEYLIFDMKAYFRYSGIANESIQFFHFIVNNTILNTAPFPENKIEVDSFTFGGAPQPNPGDVTASEMVLSGSEFTYLLDGIDNDLDGDLDRSDSDYLLYSPKKVICHYHPFWGSPDVIRADYGNWAGTQMSVDEFGTATPTGVVFDPAVSIGSGATTRRHIASKYWPLKFNEGDYSYVPPVQEDQIDFNTRAGFDYVTHTWNATEDWVYDTESQPVLNMHVRTAVDFGIDAFALDSGFIRPGLEHLNTWMHLLDSAESVSQNRGREFRISGFYDAFFPVDGMPERSAEGIGEDIRHVMNNYMTREGYLKPYRSLFNTSQPGNAFYNRNLLTASFQSFLLADSKWKGGLEIAMCPPTADFRGDLTFPFLPNNETVTFQVQSLDTVPATSVFLGIAFSRIELLDNNMAVMPNDPGQIRGFQFGSPDDAIALGSGWSGAADWGKPEANIPFRWTESANANANIADFSLYFDNGDPKNRPRFIRIRWQGSVPNLRAVLRVRNPGSGTFVDLASLDGGGFETVNGSWPIYTYRLRYSDDPADMSTICDPNPMNYDFLVDTPEYVNNSAAGAVMNGEGYYGPVAGYDAGTHVNKIGPLSITVRPGFETIRTLDVNSPKVDNRNGDEYRELWEKVLLSDPDYVFITSWNEFNESTQIEPTVEQGFKYLQLTLTYSSIFKNWIKVQKLPSISGFYLRRFDPESWYEMPAFNNTRRIEFTTVQTESLVFPNLLPAIDNTNITVTMDGSIYDAVNYSESGRDFVLNVVDTQAVKNFVIEVKAQGVNTKADDIWMMLLGHTNYQSEQDLDSSNSVDVIDLMKSFE